MTSETVLLAPPLGERQGQEELVRGVRIDEAAPMTSSKARLRDGLVGDGLGGLAPLAEVSGTKALAEDDVAAYSAVRAELRTAPWPMLGHSAERDLGRQLPRVEEHAPARAHPRSAMSGRRFATRRLRGSGP